MTAAVGGGRRKTTSANYENELDLIDHCPLAAAMRLLGGRWKLMILWYVSHGLTRSSQLAATIPNVSAKMLFQHLRELTEDGFLARRASGKQVEYALTELGESLVPVLERLAAWGEAHDTPLRARRRIARDAGELPPARADDPAPRVAPRRARE